MKDATFTLEFVSHVLGNSVNKNGEKDRFQRDELNRIVFQQAWFHSAFQKAIELSKIKGVKPSDIQVELTFEAPTKIFARRYGEGKYRIHEAIMPGTKVKFNAIVADHITEKILFTILDKMGKFVGLSPYGYKLGYGKFNVSEVTVSPSDTAIANTNQ